jgi:hypothetical protein
MSEDAQVREAMIPGCEDISSSPSTPLGSLKECLGKPKFSIVSSTPNNQLDLECDKTVILEHKNSPSNLNEQQPPFSPLTDDENSGNLKAHARDDSFLETYRMADPNNAAGSFVSMDETNLVPLTPYSQGESMKECDIVTLQHNLELSQAALEASEQQLKGARKQVLFLEKKCADLELVQQPLSTSSSNSQDSVSNHNHRDILERLRAKNAALIEQCSLLQTMSDKDADVIRDLRNSYASIHQQKVEMEVDFCNQLSAMSATARCIQDDSMEQLKAKQNVIATLKSHIHNQDNRIIQMQEELYHLKDELLNRAKVEVNTDESSEGSSNYHSPSKVLILEQEKKLLLDRVEFLTLNRTSMTEEVDDLRDQVSRLINLDTKVVPHLKEQLEATRDTLKALEREMQTILSNHAKTVEELENSLLAANTDKIRLEEDFLQQIAGLTRQKREIVLDYQTENSEKDRIIKHLEKQVKSLRDTIIQLQSKSELEEITGREETERLYQMQLVTERELSEQVAIIQELKISIREEKQKNLALSKELKKITQN